MYDGMSVYRAVVTYIASGNTYVSIPSLLGQSVSVPVSNVFGTPNLEVGDQAIVAVEDSKILNVHILNPANASSMDGGSA